MPASDCRGRASGRLDTALAEKSAQQRRETVKVQTTLWWRLGKNQEKSGKNTTDTSNIGEHIYVVKGRENDRIKQ